MGKAFNMAEKYQTPVVVLGDQHFNDSYFTVDQLDLDQIKINRGEIVFDDMISSAEDYQRYAWCESGISPRILPGHSGAVLYADSDEHTEAGHITESAEVREQMVRKRMMKLEGMRREMKQPEAYPSSNSNIVLIGWGSTYGAMKEAVDLLNREGLQTKMLHFSEIYPFPSKDFAREIKENATFFAIENNYGGQFADLFSFETGISVSHKILKYDGRPFSPGEITAQVKGKI
jgi:2-oxoglutarate ferredoxin oxidoreductase subunit alpha